VIPAHVTTPRDVPRPRRRDIVTHHALLPDSDVVNVGDELQVKVVGVDRRRGRVDLSIKDLLPPDPDAPRPSGTEQAVSAGGDDWLHEEAFVTPFELAFQEAGKSTDRRRDKRNKKAQTWDYEEEDDVIQRTIAHHRKNKGDY
jgi:predicted RNA-binding protein with RPS1 domain